MNRASETGRRTGNLRMQSGGGGFADPFARLSQKLWVFLAYLVGLVASFYLLGFIQQPILYFLAVAIPLTIFLSALVNHEDSLRFRIPLVLMVSFLPVLGWWWHTVVESPQTGSLLMAGGLWILLVYWLCLGAYALDKRFTADAELSRVVAVGDLLAVGGATALALSLLLSAVGYYLGPFLTGSPAGDVLLRLSQVWLSLLPVRAIFGIALIFGLLIAAGLRFAEDPYRAPDVDDLWPLGTASGASLVVLTALRWPLWIFWVLMGFTKHFLEHFIAAGGAFMSQWLARMAYVMVSLVGGATILVLAHGALLFAVARIAQYVAANATAGAQQLGLLVMTHVALFVAYVAYATAPILIGLRYVEDRSLREAIGDLGEYVTTTGIPASKRTAVGLTVSALALLAVPLSTVLPGGSSFGLVSITYASCMAAVMVWVAARRKQRQRVKVVHRGDGGQSSGAA